MQRRIEHLQEDSKTKIKTVREESERELRYQKEESECKIKSIQGESNRKIKIILEESEHKLRHQKDESERKIEELEGEFIQMEDHSKTEVRDSARRFESTRSVWQDLVNSKRMDRYRGNFLLGFVAAT